MNDDFDIPKIGPKDSNQKEAWEKSLLIPKINPNSNIRVVEEETTNQIKEQQQKRLMSLKHKFLKFSTKFKITAGVFLVLLAV